MWAYPMLLALLYAKVFSSWLWQLRVDLCSAEALQGRVLEDDPMPLLFWLRVRVRASTPE